MARRNTKAEEAELDEFESDTEGEQENDLLSGLSFEEPPARTRSPRSGKWAPVLDTLREHEGQWARIAVKDSSGTAAALAGNLRGGTLVGAEKGEFEATARRIPDSEQYGVFARYNPNGADEADEAPVEDDSDYADDEYTDEDE